MHGLVARVMDARLGDLLARWRSAAACGPIDRPVERLAPHADHLLVIEPEGERNRYVHYGAGFTRRFGADLTGCVIDVLPAEILPAERRGMLEFEYTYARSMGRPLWRSYTAEFVGQAGAHVETWQRLVLPLGDGRLAVGAYPAAFPGAAEDEALRLLRLVIEQVPMVLDEEGGIFELALSLRAFCDTQQQVNELELQATRDPLTDIANLRHFRRLADMELEHARRMGRPLSVLALDLDHFKSINDRWGHAAGDEALKAFVGACRLALREYDILGRVGGEEFAVALPNTGPEGAVAIAERLRRQVEALTVMPAEGETLTITVSVGVASCPAGTSPDIPELLKRADTALYRAKAAGRNRVLSAEG